MVDLSIGHGDTAMGPIHAAMDFFIRRPETVDADLPAQRRVLRRNLMILARCHDPLVSAFTDEAFDQGRARILGIRISQPEKPAKIASFTDPADPVIAVGRDVVAAVSLVPGAAPANRDIRDRVHGLLAFFNLNPQRGRIDQQPHTVIGNRDARQQTTKQQ